MDFSMSPSVSTRAFLQSIMPAPVLFRRAFTIVAEMTAGGRSRGGEESS